MQKGLSALYLILAASILVLVAGGIYFLNKPQISDEDLPSKVDSSQNTPTPSQDLTENDSLKTYTSTKAEYSFKYSADWPLVNLPVASNCSVCIEHLVFTPQYKSNSGDSNIAVILVFKEDNIKTIDDYVNIHVKNDASKVDLKNTTIGGEKAVSYKLSGGIPPLPVIEYAVVKNGFYYQIRLEDSPETNKDKEKNLQLFNQIITTFKFSN